MAKLDTTRLDSVPSGIKLGMAIADNDLVGLGRDFKKFVASRYRLIKEGDIRALDLEEMYVSIKLDGHLHFLYHDAEETFLFNPRGRVVTDLPLLAQVRDLLGDRQVVLAGELYSTASERSRVYDVTAALGSDRNAKVDQLAFGVFAIAQLDGETSVGTPHQEIQELLATLIPATSGSLHRVEQIPADAQVLTDLFTSKVVEGVHEGLILVSHKTQATYKLKQRHDADAAIIGFTERPDEPGAVRVLLTALMRPDGSFQVLAKVGGGIDESFRRELFRMLNPLRVDSQYNETDRDHTLFTMVSPQHVCEVGFHDIIMENSSGKPQMKAVLDFDPQSGYSVRVPEKFVSLIFPTFRRMRDDKEINADDLRLTQISEFVDLDNLQTPAKTQDMAASQILRRDVYVKETKGVLAVRKFISWKTNKDEIDESFPPYAFCYVDYSPTRAKPLARNVRIAPSREAIDALHAEYLEKQVKRGWKTPEEAGI